MGHAERSYRYRQLSYLVDPLTRAELALVDGGVAPRGSAEAVYRILPGGVIHMALDDRLEVRSAAYDADCKRQGYRAPDEAAFRMLPQTGLMGWGLTYWKQRALSTAAVWEYLERDRLAAKRPCIGMQGVAADFTPGLPYLAHGLDAGSFLTFAISPHAGRYGLGAYPYSRYGRIQAEWESVPLQQGAFDVVIFSGSLPMIAAEQQPTVLARAVEALKPGGALLITDTPNHDEVGALLTAQQLKLDKIRLREEGLSPLTRLSSLMSKDEPEFPPVLVAQRT